MQSVYTSLEFPNGWILVLVEGMDALKPPGVPLHLRDDPEAQKPPQLG